MAISDSKRRELQCLLAFRQQFDSQEPEQLVGVLMESLAVTKKNVYEAIAWWQSSQEQLAHARSLLAQVSESYELERLGQVEQAILLTSAEELLRSSGQSKRIIQDAIKLARKYATPEAGGLVNALLDGLCRRLEGANVDDREIVASAKALEEAEADAHQAVQQRDPA